MQSTSRGLVIAAAVGTLLNVTGCGSDMSDDPTATSKEAVRCQGINECKGMSECAGGQGDNSCQGLNECKGHGWVTVDSAKECTDKGGSVLAS